MMQLSGLFCRKYMAEIAEQQLENIFSNHRIETYSLIRLADYPAAEREEMTRHYKKWIDRGMHGEMEYLSRHTPLKYYPEKIVPGAETVILMVFPYYQASSGDSIPPSEGRIARYAWGRDYHKIIKRKLKALISSLRETCPDGIFRGFVDTSPLDERVFSARSRLGHIGRNGLLITPGFGSWAFIAEIITSVRIRDAGGSGRNPAPGPDTDPFIRNMCPADCLNCRRSCPTGALRPGGGFEAGLCISYLTIEYRGPIPRELRPLMGNRLFGCDQCQDACPLNREVSHTSEPGFLRHIAGESVSLEKVLLLQSREEMELLFAGSPVMRISLSQLLRNALVVAGNSGECGLLPVVRDLLRHEDRMVAEHAQWAEQRLSCYNQM